VRSDVVFPDTEIRVFYRKLVHVLRLEQFVIKRFLLSRCIVVFSEHHRTAVLFSADCCHCVYPVNLIFFVNDTVVVVERFFCRNSMLYCRHKSRHVFCKNNSGGIALRQFRVFIFCHTENRRQSRRSVKRFDSRSVDAIDGYIAWNVLLDCIENLRCYFHDNQLYIVLKVYHRFFNKTTLETCCFVLPYFLQNLLHFVLRKNAPV